MRAVGTPVITAQRLGKRYRLGEPAAVHATLREAIVTAAARRLRFSRGDHKAGSTDRGEIWALKDVDLDIDEGEAVGIIGPNGAGKTTLLKILARITEPTTGWVKLRGRVRSLLEVGTGFHPELTGRENIFLNGAILGMSRSEINRRFDEIVSFAEVERFLDTPVKRYSSGMYVRLAFAVAAHLEPEVLLVDEVLAVGDLSFQRKCLGKMGEVTREGRTVLFVSHQLAMINTLCERAVLLQAGRVTLDGPASEVLGAYRRAAASGAGEIERTAFVDDPGRSAQLSEVEILDTQGSPSSQFEVLEPVTVIIRYLLRQPLTGVALNLVVNCLGEVFLLSFDTDADSERLKHRERGRYEARVEIPGILKAGSYSLSFSLGRPNGSGLHVERDALKFEVTELSIDPSMCAFASRRAGSVAARLAWTTRRIKEPDGSVDATVQRP